MSDPKGFAEYLVDQPDTTRAEEVAYVAWFLAEITGENPKLSECLEFLEDHNVRFSLKRNASNIKNALRKISGVSISPNNTVRVSLEKNRSYKEECSEFLDVPEAEVADNVVVSSEFEEAPGYVNEIVRQINGCYQFGFYDACAAMMRRLVEVLIINAYSKAGEDHRIRDGSGNLVMMSGLIGALRSGQTFKLSRNAPSYLEAVKVLGDTAAHSRNYITKQKDIDDFSHKFRMLVDECKSLSD